MNFKKFSTSDNQWHDVPYYQHKTATDTLTLPAVIYPNDTSITVGIKGQSSQSGTPSPSNPVDVDGVGELETSGQYSGQYKIPILLNSQTINKYLGSEQTTRQIKKLVLTGKETWGRMDNCFRLSLPNSSNTVGTIISTHFEYKTPWVLINTTSVGACVSTTYYGTAYKFLMIRCDDIATTTTDFKEWLAAQYSAGHPVTVYYVLATPQTTTVNEPLMKIDTYADSLTTSVSCTAGGNTLDVQTTVQPSEVTANYHGWHPVSAVHERENGQWD